MEYTPFGEPMDVLTFFGQDNQMQPDQVSDKEQERMNGKQATKGSKGKTKKNSK